MNASKFGEYVTSTAFRLSLSKPQIECLCQIEQTGGTYVSLLTFNTLESKGLVARHPIRLTEAGQAVMPLLRLAGLYSELPKQQAA